MWQPLRVTYLLLDKVFEQVSRKHEGAETAEDGACENDGHSEQETVKFWVENLGVSIAQHNDGVGDWNCENHTEGQNIDWVPNRLVGV